MNEGRSRDIIQSLQKKWSLQIWIAHMLIAVAVTIFISTIAVIFLHADWWFVPLVFFVSFGILYRLLIKKIEAQDVVRFLNQSFPGLQESAQLILQPTDKLNSLEKLQLKKIEHIVSEPVLSPQLVKRRMKTAFIMLTAGSLFALLIFIIPFPQAQFFDQKNNSQSALSSTKTETRLPEIKDVTIQITPPSYTRKPARKQDKLNIMAEQKAFVNWTITTTRSTKNVQIICNDKSILHLKALNKEGTQWSANKQILQSGFYQLRIENKLSEFYQIDLIKDEPPVVIVQSPKPNTFIKWGEAQKINIAVSLSDDYGIDSSYIHATTASGSGEAVKFTELRFPFPGFRSGDKKYSLQKLIDLSSIGMTPGDELYLYITAKDNNKQEKRSDVFIVRLEDTAQLFSMGGLVSGLDIKPELFRSERQIIIETEQLLREKDTIGEQNFKKRSSNLGTDQELLRLRYGKYLGEETETEIGGDHNENEHNNAADFGNQDKVIDEFSHKHDIAEDADFFDAPTKKQLQAMLSEMWKASLQLKTYKPKEALPFAYNALRLLKDLQQKTRVFVAKTGVKTTPLNPDKRLTGELDKISQPVMKEDVQQKESSLLNLRKAIGVLEKIKSKESLDKSDTDVLEKAGTQLGTQAASHPSTYLSAYQALQRIRANQTKINDINLAGNAFQKMITSVINIPQQSQSAPDMNLSKRYFINLNKQND